MRINNLINFSQTVHHLGDELAAYGWLARAAAADGGSLRTTGRELGRTFDWPEAKVRRFLRSLEGDALIDAVSDARGLTITLRRQALKRARAQKPTQQATHEASHLTREADGVPPNGQQQTNRGSRLSADWEPSPDDLAYAAEQGFDERATHEIADHFADHWRAQPGQKGVKLDWPATWRNWIRRERRPVPRNSRNGGLSAPVGEIFDEMDRRGYDH